MNTFQKIWMWFKQVKMLPANLAKVADINKYLEVLKELTETQQRLEKIKKRLARDAEIKAGRMLFCNNVFWAQDKNGEIEDSPYCPRCFELNGEFFHLITWNHNGRDFFAKCLNCKSDEFPSRMLE